MTKILIIIILALFFSNCLQAITNKKGKKLNLDNLPYKDKYILTKNEYIFYIELKNIAKEMNWIICPKVGLKDLFEITTKENYMSHFGRISQKHIDFLICDNALRPIYAIELDDNSHKNRKDSDEFKNKLFEKSKIKLIRIKACKEYSDQYIMRNIDKEKDNETS